MTKTAIGLTLLMLFAASAAFADAPQAIPKEDVRLKPDFLAELTTYKRGFRLPEWAKPGRARQIRFDGGPMFAACQIESGWDYLTKPETPGYVGIIRSVWTLTNLYTDNIEARLDAIRAAGYNWIWASYQLGYSFADEARQRAQVRRLIQLAHARGMHVTAYFSLSSVFTRSAFIGNPESKQWIQENADGTPVAYANIPVRLMACVNKPGRLDYLKKIVRLAVEDGADDIFYDSIHNRCYCSSCERGFREYTRRVLGKACDIPRGGTSKDRRPTGIEEKVDYSGPPDDVLQNLFAEYAYYAPAKAIAELDRYAKSLNPRILVSANTHRGRYMDHVVDVTWSEDANRRGARIDTHGILTTPVGILAWCQATAEGRKPTQLTIAPFDYWQIAPQEYYQLTTAEAASFQANFVMLAGYAFAVRLEEGDEIARRAWDGIGSGLRFIERNPSLFENARPVGDVALYYSHPTGIQPAGASSSGRAVSWQTVAQNLFRAGIPMQLLTDETAVRCGAQNLRHDFKLIVLPGISCLSEEEIALLTSYVCLGGKLLLTPDCGLYTSFWEKRPNAPWPAEAPGIRIIAEEELESPARLANSIHNLLQRPPMVRIDGNGFQIAVPTLQTDRLILHILNYDTAHPLKNVRITLSPEGCSEEVNVAWKKVSVARWLTPDGGKPVDVPLQKSRDGTVLILPELKVSGLLVLAPR